MTPDRSDGDDEPFEPLEPYVPLSASDGGPVADTPMYLSHHWPDEYDRCAVIGGMHVCRRCLVLYPVALVTGVLISLGSWWPDGVNPLVLWLFPLPGVIEFVLDNVGVVTYEPRRQMWLSALGAIAAGVGYSMYIQDTFDATVWAVVAVYTTVCVVGVIVGKSRRSAA
ncbi:MAG: hypothetical protein JWO77_1836 [Ilumatobacteraceae bacterium]|nr:hypothetical protein [Ilumatobacteraceae bacterium]